MAEQESTATAEQSGTAAPAPSFADQAEADAKSVEDSLASMLGGTDDNSQADPPGSPEPSEATSGPTQPAETTGTKTGSDAKTGKADDTQPIDLGLPAEADAAKDLLGHLSRYDEKRLGSMSDDEIIGAAKEQARQAFLRNKWKSEEVDSLPTAMLLQRGNEMVEQQVTVDRRMSERSRLEQMLKEIDEEKGKGESDAGTVDGDHQVTVEQLRSMSGDELRGLIGGQQSQSEAGQSDPPTNQSDFIDSKLAELEDDEFLGPAIPVLKEVLSEIIGSTTGASASQPAPGTMQALLDAKDTENQARFDQMQAAHDELLVNNAVDRLERSYSQLSDDATRQKVFEMVYTLGERGGYHSDEGRPLVDKLARDATVLVLHDQIESQTRDELVDRYRKQTSGQPGQSDASEQQTPPEAMSTEDKLAHGMELLQQGVPAEEVRQRLAALSAA